MSSREQNYLVVPETKNGRYKVVLNKFKTSKNKDPIKVDFSEKLSKFLTKYITVQKREINSRLFTAKSGLNSSYIAMMNKSVGVSGSINYLRHAKISEELDKNNDPLKRDQLSKIMAHGATTQLSYVRNLIK